MRQVLFDCRGEGHLCEVLLVDEPLFWLQSLGVPHLAPCSDPINSSGSFALGKEDITGRPALRVTGRVMPVGLSFSRRPPSTGVPRFASMGKGTCRVLGSPMESCFLGHPRRWITINCNSYCIWLSETSLLLVICQGASLKSSLPTHGCVSLSIPISGTSEVINDEIWNQRGL